MEGNYFQNDKLVDLFIDILHILFRIENFCVLSSQMNLFDFKKKCTVAVLFSGASLNFVFQDKMKWNLLILNNFRCKPSPIISFASPFLLSFILPSWPRTFMNSCWETCRATFTAESFAIGTGTW